MSIKLEVGKSYINGNGDIIKIVDTCDINSYVFRGDSGDIFTSNGEYHINTPSDFDLIEEVDNPIEILGEKAEESKLPELSNSCPLTKREQIAMHLMSAMITGKYNDDGLCLGMPDEKIVARDAINFADELIKQLKKTENN